VAISETVLILAGGTAVLSILFGIRVAMRALAAGEAAPVATPIEMRETELPRPILDSQGLAQGGVRTAGADL